MGVVPICYACAPRTNLLPGNGAASGQPPAENSAIINVKTAMNDEKIRIRVTATGQTLDVVVLSKRVDVIEVVLGEGVHSVRCRLTPTRNGMAYVGNAMGREIVYERPRGQVQADLERVHSFADKGKRR